MNYLLRWITIIIFVSALVTRGVLGILDYKKIVAKPTEWKEIPIVSAEALTAGVGFADTSFSVDVPENSAGNTLVKIFLLTNKPGLNFPLHCTLESGDDKGHFEVVENLNRDCELLTHGQQLDYETRSQYTLTIRLLTTTDLIDPSRSLARVNVNVKDMNDNRPTFIINGHEAKPEENYLAVVPHNAPAQTFILRVKAEDRDSEQNGQIKYLFNDTTSYPGYLTVDPTTGVITNVRTFETIRREDDTPLVISVTARDRPDDPKEYLSSTISVVVNLLDDRHRMVLVLASTSPDEAIKMQTKLVDYLQERSGFIIGIEKIEVRRLLAANSTSLDTRGSDVTFYAVDPRSQRLLLTDQFRTHSFFFSVDGQYSLLTRLTNTMNVEAVEIRRPQPSSWSAGVLLATKTVQEVVDGFQAALLALASIIAVLGVAAIVYLCFLWSKYKTYQSRLQQMIITPHVEPVLIEPSLKEYETQVLRMTVNGDEGDDYLNTLDTTSFIVKTSSPTMRILNTSGYTEESTDSLESPTLPAYGNRDELDTSGNNNGLMIPALNPIYQSSDENSPPHDADPHILTTSEL